MGTSPQRTAEDSGFLLVSGGSAANKLAAAIAKSGLRAAHVLAVFDNGGSTGRLREVCGGIALGDIRNRLAILARRETPAGVQIADLMSYRLPSNKSQAVLRSTVENIAQGMTAVPAITAAEIGGALRAVLERLPRDFDWREASVGNLVLLGRYLQCQDWDRALDWAHTILDVHGLVVPVTTDTAHLGARLCNQRYILGQRTITDEAKQIASPIQSLRLHTNDRFPRPTRARLNTAAKREIDQARVIIYSWGSFYTSLLCSFLVDDFPRTVAASRARKVLLLNPFRDAETTGKTPAKLVSELEAFGRAFPEERLVTDVFALRSSGSPTHLYSRGDRKDLERAGVEVTEFECEGLPEPAHLAAIISKLSEMASSPCEH